MSDYPEVPDPVLNVVRRICTGFPEIDEQRAWTGIRWRVRTKTIAHLLVVEPGRPEAYSRAASVDRPTTVLTFRSEPPELEVLVRSGHPFFVTPWGQDSVGMIIDEFDPEELRELLTESYCLSAPKKLAESIIRPPG
nr:MmcQ/YjbR family DNA-binding protein [Rhodococcus sp. (in: high G+C Gram-positive bacteria)]